MNTEAWDGQRPRLSVRKKEYSLGGSVVETKERQFKVCVCVRFNLMKEYISGQPVVDMKERQL